MTLIPNAELYDAAHAKPGPARNVLLAIAFARNGPSSKFIVKACSRAGLSSLDCVTMQYKVTIYRNFCWCRTA